MRTFVTVWFWVLIFALSAEASERHLAVAKNFLKYHGLSKTIQSFEALRHEDITVGYLFALSGGGYILMPASEALTPIKAYSFGNDFSNLPPAVQDFYIKELASYHKAIDDGLIPMADTQNSARWDFLLKLEPQKMALSYTPDTHLLTSKWDQGYPYNKYLPEINGQKTLAGCVNIALGQLMKYHRSPKKGAGVVSYNYNNQLLKAVLYKNYNWDNIPDVLTATTPQHQIDETAWLIRDLGIVNKTQFGVSDSGASLKLTALVENLGFSNDIKTIRNTDDELFFNTIRLEIDALRPVLLSFPGHMTVADGYASDQTGKKIHVNMGWGGAYDDYYYLDRTVKAGPYSFSPNLKIYYNLKPCSGSDCHADKEATDNIVNNVISGKFNYSLDVDVYPVFLKGNTTITGRLGNYSTQSFYLSLYDSSKTLITQSDKTITIANLPAGRYFIGVSLYASDGGFYYYSEQNSTYTININSSELTPEEIQTAIASSDIPPEIATDFVDISFDTSQNSTYQIYVNAYDANNDNLTLTVYSSNPNVLRASFEGNVLILTKGQGSGVVKITLTATANAKSISKSFNVFVVTEAVGFGKDFRLNGYFANGTDLYKHKVILDGNCSISGSRGYTNQAFFISVYKADNSLLKTPTDSAFAMRFEKAIYYIGASLTTADSFYQYDNRTNYTISIKCPNADDSVQTIAGILSLQIEKPQSYTINLTKGWNFISLPKQPGNASINAVLRNVLAKVQIVWGFDNQAKNWRSFKPSASNNTLSSMQAGEGYWIYCTEVGSLEVEGDDHTMQFDRLSAGWNLIGWSGQDGAGITTLIEQLGSTWDAIWTWHDGQWSFKSANPALQAVMQAPELTKLYRGRAYWILKK